MILKTFFSFTLTILKPGFSLPLFLLLAGLSFSCNSGSSESHKQEAFSEQQREQRQERKKLVSALQAEVQAANWPDLIPAAARREEIKAAIQSFYKSNNYKPLWNTYKEGGQSRILLQRLQQLGKEGLEPTDFPVEELQKQLQEVHAKEEPHYQKAARLELRLSANYLLLARQLAKGRMEPGKFYSKWHIRPEEADRQQNLRLLAEKGVAQALAELEPDYRQYALLKEQLSHYKKISEQGGWQEVYIRETVAPGDSSAALPAIRRRIARETKLSDTSSHHFDQGLSKAVQSIRSRYGFGGNSAVIDAPLVEALNVPVEERVRQIALNLERIRWLTEPMGERYVLVNLPEYRLRVVEDQEVVLAMKVVIGEIVHTTPIFSDSMEYLVFAPYWNVPEKIAREEILPQAKEDPSYLDRKHYQVVKGWQENASVVDPQEIDWENISLKDFPYRIRQKPGPWNSLGRVKFIFPNNMAIYLHDTPANHLFKESERGFSHGCIRVEKPAALADYLLEAHSREEVESLMKREDRKVIPLEEKVPVYLVYFTTIVDRQGRLRFLPDIYELDNVQQQALQSS